MSGTEETAICIRCGSAVTRAILFEVPEETLKEKIVQFRKMGCTLFSDGNV